MMNQSTMGFHGLLCFSLVEYPMEYFNTAYMGQYITTPRGIDFTPIRCYQITNLLRCLFSKQCFISVNPVLILNEKWNKFNHINLWKLNNRHFLTYSNIFLFRSTSMDSLFLGWFAPMHHEPSRKTSSNNEILCLPIDWRCYI